MPPTFGISAWPAIALLTAGVSQTCALQLAGGSTLSSLHAGCLACDACNVHCSGTLRVQGDVPPSTAAPVQMLCPDKAPTVTPKGLSSAAMVTVAICDRSPHSARHVCLNSLPCIRTAGAGPLAV